MFDAMIAWGQSDPIPLYAVLIVGAIGGFLTLTSIGYFSFVHVQSSESMISTSEIRSVARRSINKLHGLSFLLAVIEPPVLVAALVIFMARLATRF